MYELKRDEYPLHVLGWFVYCRPYAHGNAHDTYVLWNFSFVIKILFLVCEHCKSYPYPASVRTVREKLCAVGIDIQAIKKSHEATCSRLDARGAKEQEIVHVKVASQQ